MSRYGGLLTLVTALVLSVVAPRTALAAPLHELHKKVVVVVVDGLQLSDITPEQTPHLWQMQQQGAVGVMNQNTLGLRTDVNSYLTIGAGTKAGAPFAKAEAYDMQERFREEGHVLTGRDLYRRNVGSEPHGRIVVPQLPQIVQQASQARSTVQPGLLGDVVQQLGGHTAVLGNADLGHEVHRPAALLAMNGQGTVDFGDLHTGVVADRTRPYGLRSDMKALFARYQRLRDHANLIVLETGDLLRVTHAAELMTPEQAALGRRQAVQEADQLVGMLLPEAGASTLLAVIAPTKAAAKDLPPVAPVLLAGGAMQPGGLLTSNTTRRAGLLANYDLAPTFAAFLGGDPQAFAFLGVPVQTLSTSQPAWQALHQLVADMWVPSRARSVIVRPWLNVWIALTVLILLASLLRRHWLRFVQPVAEMLLILPLSWLFVPLYQPDSVLKTFLLSVGISLAIWVLLTAWRDRTARLGALAALTALTLIADVLLGAPLEKQALLSYDPFVGARYYGIGNEYMGVLLGALLLWLNAWYRQQTVVHRRGQAIALLLFVLVIYLFAAPTLGTNFGGALAAAVCFTYAMLQFAGIGVRAKHLLTLTLVFLLVLLGMALLNLLLPSGEQTHIGHALQQLLSGQYAAVWQIAARKVALNLQLLRVSAWGRLFLLFGAVLLVAALRQKWRAEQQALFLSRNGKMILLAALAAFCFNDSGVVAAALTLLYAVVPLVEVESVQRQ